MNRLASWIYRRLYGSFRPLDDDSPNELVKPVVARMAEPDIDRFHYPPPPNGIPLLDVSSIIERHKKTISRIQFATGDNEAFFSTWYAPLILSYAKFVHLLPASENSHHALPGGMLAHGLEVALSAMLRADRAIVGMHKVPEQRIPYEKKWKLAVFIAAIAHDIGKPLSDVLVHDEKGNQWSPYLDSLYDWGVSIGAKFYVITWNRNRYKQHEAMATEALNYILNSDVKNFLYDGSPEILTLLMSAISGAENQIRTIVTQADQESSALDAKRNPMRVSDMKYGIPVALHLKDAISRYLSGLNKIDVNTDNGQVFYLSDGLYLKWPDAMPLIMEHFPTQQMMGVPTSAPQFADVLIEAGLAKAGEGLFSSRLRTWRITDSHGSVRDGWYLKLTAWDTFVDSFDHQSIKGGIWVPKTEDIVEQSSLDEKSGEDHNDGVSGDIQISTKILKTPFEKYGNMGEILFTALGDLQQGKIKSGLGEPIILDAKDLPLLWSFVQSQGIPAKIIMDEVRALKIHKPFEGTKLLHPIDGKQYLVLNEEVRELVKTILESSKSTDSASNVFSDELMNIDYIKLTDEAIKAGDTSIPAFVEDENGKLLEVSAWVQWLNRKTGTSQFLIQRAILKQVSIEYFVVTQDQKRYLRVD